MKMTDILVITVVVVSCVYIYVKLNQLAQREQREERGKVCKAEAAERNKQGQ